MYIFPHSIRLRRNTVIVVSSYWCCRMRWRQNDDETNVDRQTNDNFSLVANFLTVNICFVECVHACVCVCVSVYVCLSASLLTLKVVSFGWLCHRDLRFPPDSMDLSAFSARSFGRHRFKLFHLRFNFIFILYFYIRHSVVIQLLTRQGTCQPAISAIHEVT